MRGEFTLLHSGESFPEPSPFLSRFAKNLFAEKAAMSSRLPGAGAAATPGGSRRRSPRLQGSENSAQSGDVSTKSDRASSRGVAIAHNKASTSVNQAEAGAALPDGAQAATDDDSRMAASSTRNAGAAVRPLATDSDSDSPSGSQI